MPAPEQVHAFLTEQPALVQYGQTRGPTDAEPSFGPCKGLDYELEVGIFVGPGNDPGESIPADRAESHVFGLCLLNFSAGYDSLKASHLVPLLEDDGMLLTQSLAIIEYLDETHPQSLVPSDARSRARACALAQAIACDIHPINNLRVVEYLSAVI